MGWLSRLFGWERPNCDASVPPTGVLTVTADSPPVDPDAAAAAPQVVPTTIGLREFDLATLTFDTSVYWKVRDRQTGEEHVCSSYRPDGVSATETVLGVLTPWLVERSDGRPALVRAFSAEMRREASAELIDPTVMVLADLISCRPSQKWADAARTELGAARNAHVESAKRATPRNPLKTSPIVYAASDGSKHPKSKVFGCAWVTSTGHFEVTGGKGTIGKAELHGAVGFLRWFLRNRKHPEARAVLFVDRMETYEILTGTSYLPLHAYGEVDEAVDLVRDGHVEVIWVRGHATNELNLLADRLALQKYRAVRAGIEWASTDQLCRGMVDDQIAELEGVKWAQVAEAARAAHARHRSERAAHV